MVSLKRSGKQSHRPIGPNFYCLGVHGPDRANPLIITHLNPDFILRGSATFFADVDEVNKGGAAAAMKRHKNRRHGIFNQVRGGVYVVGLGVVRLSS